MGVAVQFLPAALLFVNSVQLFYFHLCPSESSRNTKTAIRIDHVQLFANLSQVRHTFDNKKPYPSSAFLFWPFCLSVWVNSSHDPTPTFADVFIFQPKLPLDLLVGIPDGAGLLKAIDSFLDIVVPKTIQKSHKISSGCGSIQRMEGIAESCKERDAAI